MAQGSSVGEQGAPTRRDSRRNREALLAAAARLFASGPSVSMSDVGLEAGLTRATVYRHFPDRDALLNALIGQLAATIVPGLVARLEGTDLGTAMDLVADVVAQSTSRHRHLITAVTPRLEQMVREAVVDEPIEAFLRVRREAGDLVSAHSDAWLARCIRALCLASVDDPRTPAAVTADLAPSLRRLVGLGWPG